MASVSAQINRIIFLSVARTATPTSVSYNDKDHKRLGGHFNIDTTAIGAAPSVVPVIQGFDTPSGKWYNILTGAAITAIGTVTLRVYPGVAAAANLSVPDILPPIWRLVMTHGNADSITYIASAWLRD